MTRTKIGLLSILSTVLLAFGGVAVAQDYGTETDPQDTTTTTTTTQRPVGTTVQDPLNRDLDVDADVNVRNDGVANDRLDADVNVRNEAVANDRFANDEFDADDELPRTASFLPALGALGLMTLAGGAALGARKS